MIGLVGKKLGMTRIFTEEGTSIPVTIIEVEDNRIVQIKSLKKDGYEAIQVTTGYKKKHRINKAEAGHFSKGGTEVGRGLWEFRIDKCRNLTNIYQKLIVGKNFNIEIFSNTKKVDITGHSKGKGFAGTVKRWNFHTQDATHGNSLSHRVPGSVGQNQTPGKVFKGKKMAGHLGANRVTIQNLKLVSVDNIKKLMIVQGSVPGANGSNLIIKPASKV